MLYLCATSLLTAEEQHAAGLIGEIETKDKVSKILSSISAPQLQCVRLSARQKILLETKKQLQCYGFFNLSTLKKYLDYKITAELLLDVLEHVKLIAVIAVLEYFICS